MMGDYNVESEDDVRERRIKPTTRAGFAHEAALIFGVVQLMCGIVALILGVIAIASQSWGHYYGSGFWGGGFFAIAGSLALASARKKTNGLIVSLMVLSAFSAMLALVMLALAAIGISAETVLFQNTHGSSQTSALVVQSLLIVVAIIEAICATACSVIGCKAMCGAWYSSEQDNYDYAIALQGCSSYADQSARYMPQCQQTYRHGDPPVQTGLTLVSGANMDPQQIPFPMSSANQTCQIPIGVQAPQGRYQLMGRGESSLPVQGCTQVMYIMPPAPPCPQPGTAATTDDVPPGTPPPSYSTLELDQLAQYSEAQQDSLVSASHSLDRLPTPRASPQPNRPSRHSALPSSPPPEYSQARHSGQPYTAQRDSNHRAQAANHQRPTLLELSHHSYAAQMREQMQLLDNDSVTSSPDVTMREEDHQDHSPSSPDELHMEVDNIAESPGE